MSILDLSYELLLLIADHLPDPPDIFALLLTHRGLAYALAPAIEKLAKRPENSTAALFCYIAHGNAPRVRAQLEFLRKSWHPPITESTVTAAITAGANYDYVLPLPFAFQFVPGGEPVPPDMPPRRALHWATINNKPFLLTFLLTHGASVTYRDPSTGGNALDQAIISGKHRLVSLLLAHGADAAAWELKCGSLLHCTISCARCTETPSNFLPIMTLLCDAGADVAACDMFGHTALHLAALCWEAAVPLLIQRGADVNARDAAGNTALHLAVFGPGQGTCVADLLAAGADPETRNLEGLAPVCARRGVSARVEVIKLLGEHKCGAGCGDGRLLTTHKCGVGCPSKSSRRKSRRKVEGKVKWGREYEQRLRVLGVRLKECWRI